MSAFWILTCIFGFILVKHAMDNASQEKQRKMDLLEEAVRSGALDQESKEQLMQGLAGQPRRARAERPAKPAKNPYAVGLFTRFMAFVGWMAMALGVAFAIIVNISYGNDYLDVPAAILCSVGFALTTYPFVIRELQARTPVAEERNRA